MVASEVGNEHWIFDSAYSQFLDLVLTRVEVVIGLDYPRWLSLSRLIRRTMRRLVTKEQSCNGNVESWSTVFSKKSIIAWHFRSFTHKHDRMFAWANQADGPKVMLIQDPAQLAWLISTLKQLHR
ncbi:hypothetical protein [Changpingibacter yushuensis]|uniref:hypothetical protein n=1 Tax=Changpingibacter yushuensis TaxID=2758440 RepID=UPI001C7173F1|nr:hypothetical protein [Changpingibacter yushuensis]